jgi:hypothetical protein
MDLFKRRTRNFWRFLPFLLAATPLFAQEKSPDAEDKPAAAENADALRKAAQNPVASLISVPVQNNNNCLTDSWNLIARIITPIIYQPLPPVDTQPSSQGVYGFGDLNPTFSFSPSKPSKIIWGVGPAIVLPTATNKFLGQGKWSIGPGLVALTQPGKWTLGILVNNVWSFAGQSSRKDVNQMLFQYFINYNLQKGWYITWQSTLTADWEQTNGGRWVVPVGGGIGRIMRLGFQG